VLGPAIKRDIHLLSGNAKTSRVSTPLTKYSAGATKSTTPWFSSALLHLSAGWFVCAFQSNSCGTSFRRLHMQHFQRAPPSMNCTYGLM
jgi:hypothetical protein